MIYDINSQKFHYLLRLLNETKIFCGEAWKSDTFRIETTLTFPNYPNVLGFLNIVIFALLGKELDMEGPHLVESAPRYGKRVWEKLNDPIVKITF